MCTKKTLDMTAVLWQLRLSTQSDVVHKHPVTSCRTFFGKLRRQSRTGIREVMWVEFLADL